MYAQRRTHNAGLQYGTPNSLWLKSGKTARLTERSFTTGSYISITENSGNRHLGRHLSGWQDDHLAAMPDRLHRGGVY